MLKDCCKGTCFYTIWQKNKEFSHYLYAIWIILCKFAGELASSMKETKCFFGDWKLNKTLYNMKTTLRILLGISIFFLAYICVMSVVTPIKFEDTRSQREDAIVKNLVSLRTAVNEYKIQNGRYTQDLDSVILFLKNGKKKEVIKEGALTEAQLEAGMTESKAVKIIKRGNLKEIQQNGLEGFRRDTIYTDLIQALYKGEYTAENIDQITYIPYSNNLRFEVKVDNEYSDKNGVVPLIEVGAPFETYLGDLDEQELVNLIDKEKKLDHYPGLRFGAIDAPNNNAGNWE